MKRIMVFFLFLVFAAFLFADWVDISENSSQELFDHVSYGIGSTEVNFALDGYEIEIIKIEGIEYKKISYWNEGEFIEIGKPALPRFSRLIAIPDAGNVEFDIIYTEEEIISNINIFPRQNLQSESQPVDNEFVIDEAFYNKGEVFPGKVVEIGEPAIMRDFRIVNVTINPFQYDPQTRELRIVTNVEIVVNTSGTTGKNIKQTNRKLSRFFEPIYKATILNYDSLNNREDGFQQPCYLFIYPDDSTIETNLEYLTDWKHQKGFEVHTASTAQTGTTNTLIKDYIQDAYDTWENPPEFVCLVGDAGGSFNIPTGYYSVGEGDQVYTLLEGGDILADVFIGRLSFNSIIEFQTIIAKILNYEKEPYMTQTNWYQQALLVGDPSSSEQSCIITSKYIKEIIEANAPYYNYYEVYSSPFVSQMNSAINSGVTYFNYRGYLGMSGWGNDDIGSLNNGFMLPVMVFLTCGTGNFANSLCESEYALKVGTPSVPKGAIAAIGTATMSTHTCFNNCVAAGTFCGIFVDKIYNMGGALTRGKLNLYLSYPQNPNNWVEKKSYWNNLMGDPGMEVWTDIPSEIVVTYPATIPFGTNYIEVTVENTSEEPVSEAWVTALMGDDDIFATGYTNEDGFIILPIDAQITGSVNLTVTKHDFIPHLGSFDIGISDRFVNVFEISIDDDNLGTSSGNGDGIVNPGEDIELNVSLRNFGILTANNVTATISTEDEFITITDTSEDYGNITAGNSTYSSDDFDFSVNTNVLGGTEIQFDILIQDALRNQWTDFIFISVEGANLYASDYTVVNDPNGVLDPGETAQLEVTIENVGFVGTNEIYGTLISSDNRITINDSIGYFGNISAGGQAINSTNRFELTANTQIIPGSQFILELHLYNVDGYDDTVSFILEVGEVTVTDPLGPDSYGYYCYDSGDTTYDLAPVYSWIEIDPTYGGSGTTINLYDPGDTGDIEIINMPFNFNFYGLNYSSITVCSNGWIAPGITEQYSFMNWPLPGPLGPSPMIAPFWDDLKIVGGCVCYYYDISMHYFIVEWSHLQNDYNNAEETFQVIIYDPAYYPTPTGDAKFVFQYETINNVDLGHYSYPVQHGQYATVGLEDHTGLIGLEYTYNNQYPTAAKVLEDEMALLFTCPPIHQIEPYIVLGGITINDTNGNGLIDYGEDIDLDITLNNLGEETATDVSAVLSTSDAYITITANSSSYNDISGGVSGVNLTDYEFTVVDTCPDGHIISFQLDVISNEGNWNIIFGLEANAPVIEFTSLYIDDGDNNMLDPGETTDILVTFTNNGGADAYSTSAFISTDDIYLTINSATFDFGTFPSGQSKIAVFNVTADVAAPIGHSAVIDWNVAADYSYSVEDSFSIFIGLIIENFETGDFSSFPWEFAGSADWTVVTEDPHEGTYCAKSGSISHSQTSELILEADVTTAGTISFYRKVSSESSTTSFYDGLKFFIDGVEQDKWQGEVAWSQVSFPVSTGNRTFKWQYYKDSSVSSGSDCAWVDYIIFPPLGPPQPLFILAPTSIDFGNVFIGTSSTEQFTISNPGGAALTGTITTPAGYTVATASDIILRSKKTQNNNNSDNIISYDIPATQEQTFDLVFSPLEALTYNGNVVITSNDTNHPTNNLNVTGVGIIPADIIVNPSQFDETLQPGNSTSDVLTIGNMGGVTLDYTARVVYLERNTFLENHTISESNMSRIDYSSEREIKPLIIVPLIKEAPNSGFRDCTFTIDLYDDYGDGWNGGSLDVMVNSLLVLDDITLSTGSGPASFDIPIATGDSISTIYTAGSWAYENSYFIYDNDGVQVASDGTGGVEPTGLSPFAVTCTNDPTLAWLTLDGQNQVSGSIDSGSPDDVLSVLFDTVPDSLADGIYEANIEITSNDPDEPSIIVPVTLTVSQQLDPPANVQIQINGSSIQLSWDVVSGATSYKVYSSNDINTRFTEDTTGMFNVTSWTTTTVAQKKFYYVKAVN